MRYVPFGGTGIEVSALGFGCGPMGSRFGARESRRALDSAFDCGITVFDTARVYGHGDAEGILGRFARGKRDRIVISTKFGLNPGRSSRFTRLVKAVARPVLRAIPSAKAMATSRARASLGAQMERGTFSAGQMRASVERSLSELRTDYLDVLFLHSCPAEVARDEDLFLALQVLVREGKVRCVGVASSAQVIVEVACARRSIVRAAQFHQSLVSQSDAAAVAPAVAVTAIGTMAHQPFGGPDGIGRMRRAISVLCADQTISSALRAKLSSSDPDLLPDLALNGVLRNCGVDVAVCAMYNPAHIRTNAKVVDRSSFSDGEIAEVQAWFRDRAATS